MHEHSHILLLNGQYPVCDHLPFYLHISDHSLNCDHRAERKREKETAHQKERESYCGSFKGELYLRCCYSEQRRVIKNARPDKEGLGAGVKSGSAEGSRMRRLIYGPFQPVCFKRDLAYTQTLTRFFTGPFYHALLLKYTRFHSHAMLCIGMCQCVMPRMYMFMALVSFRCWGAGAGREGARWTQHACIYMHCVFVH